MGTSGRSSGPKSGTPLVPSWLDESSAAGSVQPPPAGAPVPISTPPEQSSVPLPALPAVSAPGRFRAARSNFSRFASSGGNDRRSLNRAVRDYIRTGAGGSKNATRRMGASRSTAAGVLGLLRDFQRDGVDATLRRLNLGDLVGRPLEQVFAGLTDVVCPDGGSIDEGIALDAWLETVAALEGLADLAALTPEQMSEIFLTFISHSIQGRLLQDIGANGLKVAADLDAIESFQTQLDDYIARSVRDSFSSDISAPVTLSDRQIQDIVNSTYQDAWELLVAWGDSAR